MFESVRALTAEDNLSTGDPKNAALCSPPTARLP
jgi:hypothetical protein